MYTAPFIPLLIDWLVNALQTAGADSLLPGIGGLGIGGAVALIVMQWKRADDLKHTADMERLATRYIELGQKQIEGMAAIASTLAEIKTAIQQGRAEHELEKRLEEIMERLENPAAAPPPGNSRRGKGQT